MASRTSTRSRSNRARLAPPQSDTRWRGDWDCWACPSHAALFRHAEACRPAALSQWFKAPLSKHRHRDARKTSNIRPRPPIAFTGAQRPCELAIVEFRRWALTANAVATSHHVFRETKMSESWVTIAFAVSVMLVAAIFIAQHYRQERRRQDLLRKWQSPFGQEKWRGRNSHPGR